MSERLTLVSLIERFANGLESYDPSFARTLAAALHGHGDEITLPAVEELKLSDVIVTFRMDREMQLVITGNLSGGPGEITLRYHERAFPEVEVCLHETPAQGAYVFATLDHGWRGRAGRLKTTGERVVIRSLTTVGEEISWHVRQESGSRTIALEELELLDSP